MSRRKYRAGDVLAAERGVVDVTTKRSAMIDQATAARDTEQRHGLRQLDRAVENAPWTAQASRAAKDQLRALPRATVAPLGHRLKDRRLLPPDAVRIPMSKRQRVERLHGEKHVARSLSAAQHKALTTLTGDKETWRSLNQELSAKYGDLQELDGPSKRMAMRVDKAIQRYEELNDRGHRVYTNVKLPRGINSTNALGFLKNYLPVGSVVNFDQYTAGSHNLDEVSEDTMTARDLALEIHTRRGMFIGKPGDAKSNGHLMPRGMQLQVAGIEEATYTRPDGTRGRRMLVQLLDMTEGSQEES